GFRRELAPREAPVDDPRAERDREEDGRRDQQTVPEGHPGPFDALERLPAAEPVLDVVPVANLLLADAPAEQHLLAVAQPRKVEQPRVDVLHLCAERMD